MRLGIFNLYLYDSFSSVPLGSSTSSSNIETVSIDFLSGTYYIKVSSLNGGKGFYEMRLNATMCYPHSARFNLRKYNSMPRIITDLQRIPSKWSTSYTWTLPSGWNGSSASTSITATVGSNGGNISVTANNSCGTSALASLTVTVHHTCPARFNSGNTAVCQGVSQTYSIAAVAGATSYTWTLPSGWSGSSNSTSITATAGAASGNISVTANNTCGSGAARTLSVTATALPGQAGTITGETRFVWDHRRLTAYRRLRVQQHMHGHCRQDGAGAQQRPQ